MIDSSDLNQHFAPREREPRPIVDANETVSDPHVSGVRMRVSAMTRLWDPETRAREQPQKSLPDHPTRTSKPRVRVSATGHSSDSNQHFVPRERSQVSDPERGCRVGERPSTVAEQGQEKCDRVRASCRALWYSCGCGGVGCQMGGLPVLATTPRDGLRVPEVACARACVSGMCYG